MLHGIRPGIGDITHPTGDHGHLITGIITTVIIHTITLTITGITITVITTAIRIITITITTGTALILIL
jgi:hypothetical protein